MRYIVMCGGIYPKWKTPRQLIEINGEPIVMRTIRLLRENGIDDIAISSNSSAFDSIGVPVLQHDNEFVCDQGGAWVDAFYPTDDPVCYLMGDVVFSPQAIETIVNTDTDDVAFFASVPPFAREYPKRYAEPFAFKVTDTAHFKRAIEDVRKLRNAQKFWREPIAWELWNVLRNGINCNCNRIEFDGCIAINDYTCDIDTPGDVKQFRAIDL